MVRALVTGATGFIGRHVVEALVKEGSQVRCLVRLSPRVAPLQQLGVELFPADLRATSDLRSAVRGCDVVYHLAGKTSALTRQELYQTNARGSFVLARACAAQDSPPPLIVVSSLAAAGTAIAGRPRREEDRAHPVSDYGRSKRACEWAAIAWAHRVPISIVRPAIVFGPRNKDLLPLFQSITRLGLHPVPGLASRRVALIHQQDLVDVLFRVARQGQRVRTRPSGADDQPGDDQEGYYFAADPEFPSFGRLGRMIAKATGTRRLWIVPVAEPVAWTVAAGNQGLNRLLRRYDTFNVDKMREAFAGDWTVRIERLANEFGFRPAAPLQQRLDETASWYRREGWI
jgi:nucleoside-diphosphate-sugar epimerase